jgi:hypothetical protein
MDSQKIDSVIALDGAPYHCFHTDNSPSAYAVKADLLAVNCNETMQKNELYSLCLGSCTVGTAWDACYHYNWSGQFIHVVSRKIQGQLEECDVLDVV